MATVEELVKKYEDELGATNPQKAALITGPLKWIGENLLALERQGLKLELTEAQPTPPVEFPKMMYHDNLPPMTVENEHAADELIDKGWRDHP